MYVDVTTTYLGNFLGIFEGSSTLFCVALSFPLVFSDFSLQERIHIHMKYILRLLTTLNIHKCHAICVCSKAQVLTYFGNFVGIVVGGLFSKEGTSSGSQSLSSSAGFGRFAFFLQEGMRHTWNIHVVYVDWYQIYLGNLEAPTSFLQSLVFAIFGAVRASSSTGSCVCLVLPLFEFFLLVKNEVWYCVCWKWRNYYIPWQLWINVIFYGIALFSHFWAVTLIISFLLMLTLFFAPLWIPPNNEVDNNESFKVYGAVTLYHLPCFFCTLLFVVSSLSACTFKRRDVSVFISVNCWRFNFCWKLTVPTGNIAAWSMYWKIHNWFFSWNQIAN